jgi:hypothetical protein
LAPAQAVTALHMVVSDLASNLPPLTTLDLPPPYDPSRVVLTYNPNSGVSDMASGSHVPQWAVWQKTHSGLMSQFLESATPGEDKPAPSSTASDPVSVQITRRSLQSLLGSLSSPLLKRFSDTSEKVRMLSLETATLLLASCPDLTAVLPYLLPALLQRSPPAYFDQETDVFIHDMEAHEACVPRASRKS